MNQRILFILTSHDRKGDAPSGYYLSEVSHPYYILRDAGYQIDFASPKGGKTHVDGLDLSDPDNAAFWNDAALRAQTENTLAPADINADDYAAICHGPAGLLNIRLANGRYLIENKQVAAFTNDEERAVGLYDTVPFLLADALQERGAIHLPAANFQAQTIVSERLVSGQKPASARGVARAMLSLLR